MESRGALGLKRAEKRGPQGAIRLLIISQPPGRLASLHQLLVGLHRGEDVERGRGHGLRGRQMEALVVGRAHRLKLVKRTLEAAVAVVRETELPSVSRDPGALVAVEGADFHDQRIRRGVRPLAGSTLPGSGEDHRRAGEVCLD